MSYAIHSIREINFAEMDSFTCGVQSMDEFLYQFARHYDEENDAKTWVLADLDAKKIAGYFTLKSSAISLTQDGGTHVTIPAVEIARIAIRTDFQGNGIGKDFIGLVHTYIRDEVQSKIGVRLSILFAIPSVVPFYRAQGYQEIQPDSGVEVFMSWECANCVFMYRAI